MLRDRCHFALAGLKENEALSLGSDAGNVSARLGSDDEIAFRIDDHRARVRLFGLEELAALPVRAYAVNDAFIAGRNIEVSRLIKRHCPDILSLRIEEQFRFPAASNSIDFRIRRSRGIEAILFVDCKRMNFKPREFSGHMTAASRRNGVDLRRGTGRRPAGAIESTARILDNGPKIRNAGIRKFAEGWR